MGCIAIDKQAELNQASYEKIAKEFSEIPAVKQLGQSSIGLWKAMVYNATKGRIPEDGIPNTEQLKLLKIVADRSGSALSKNRGGLAKAVYLPEEILKDLPFTKDWFEAVQASDQRYKGDISFFNTHITEIFKNLRQAAFTAGGNKEFARFSSVAKPKAQKKLELMYKEYLQYKREGDMQRADNLYENVIVKFLKEGEGAVFKDFHDLASASPKRYKELLNEKKYDDHVVSAANVWREKIHKRGKTLLVQGLNAYRDGLKKSAHLLGDFTNYGSTLKNIDRLIERYNSKELQKDGYFPVLTLEIMPSLSEAAKYLRHAKNEAEFNKGADIVGKLEKVLDENIYINRHLNDKSAESGPISYNVIPLIDSYARSVSRFNYVAYNTSKYMDVMKDLHHTASNKGEKVLDAKLTALEGYISDSYSMITGEKGNNRSSSANNFARAITAWQFISKLGLNVRSATRNATQSLLNWVWFGKKGMQEVGGAMKDAEMSQRVNDGLADNGILFPEIKEIYFQDFAPKVEYNKNTGTYREKVDASYGDAIAESLSKVAAKVGKPMQWVENKINRRYTYQLGYVTAWMADSARIQSLEKRFQRNLKRQGKDIDKMMETEATIFKNKDSNEYQAEFEKFRRARANRHGNAAVKNLHYDYAMTAKSKVLTTRTGSILGQFQHYGINFFNLQRKIVRDGFDDVATSQWQGEGAWRMYRLGMLYSAIYGIFSPLLNADVGNLVQNDTLERIMNYHDAALSDDPEVRKKAFFGKGPAIGSVGGPFIADAVTLGNLSGLYEMDEDGWAGYLAGYQDLADESTDEKFKEIVRLLNTQVARTWFTTIPKWRGGANVGSLVAGEIGLNTNADVRDRRENWYGLESKKQEKRKAPPKYDEAVLRALDQLMT